MKTLFAVLTALVLTIGMIGCSDDDNPAKSPNPPVQTSSDTTVWDADGQFFRSTVDATSETEFAKFSFADGENDTVGATSKVAAPVWDIEFRREEIRTNGGVSSEGGGAIKVTSLGAVDFAAVTIADTTGKSWSSDQIEYFFDNWYDYNVNTHQLVANRRIYSMVDAGGHNYVKFRIDSLTGAGMPPDMGTVWLTYYYQPTADSRSLPGPTVSTHFAVESGTVYFDFSSGSVVTPAIPGNATNWDLGFSAYEVFMNSGPKGVGLAEGFYAYSEVTDPTDINAFTTQPDAPMFTDIFGSAMTDWYAYDGSTHQLPSRGYVYLIKDVDAVYKLKIENYYKNVSGTAQSGNYTFIWNKL